MNKNTCFRRLQAYSIQTNCTYYLQRRKLPTVVEASVMLSSVLSESPKLQKRLCKKYDRHLEQDQVDVQIDTQLQAAQENNRQKRQM